MTRWTIVVALATLLIGGCKKTDEGTTDKDDPKQAEAAAPVTDEAIDKLDLPVKEDYEEEAYRSINEDTLETQLDELEKEISGDAK